ncbi:MAG: polysaccharide biosynthesis protein [Candidatus Dadabacteria bacterium]|nr:MAG: polysaccharide biosynthesis protein [Candidatus Dadabacteria bacterium]
MLLAVAAIRTLLPLRRPTWNTEHLRYIAGYAVPLIPYALGTFALGQIDRVLLYEMRSAEDAGLYSVVYNLAMMLPLAAAALQRGLLPDWFRLRNDGDLNGSDRLALQSFALVAGLGVLLLLCADETVYILADRRYAPAGALMWIIVAAYVLDDLGRFHARLIGFTRKMLWVSVVGLTAAVVNVLLNLWWIPLWGMAGAAWATLVSFLVSALLNRVCAVWILGQPAPPVRQFVPALLCVAIAAALRAVYIPGELQLGWLVTKLFTAALLLGVLYRIHSADKKALVR